MNLLFCCIMFGLLSVMTVRHVTAQSPSDAVAQNYPNKTVRIIVSFSAGGPSDVLARAIGQRMSEEWGQPVVIENRPGDNGTIGARLAAKASPDGYTLFAALDTVLVMSPIMTTNLSYDPFKDFVPITLVSKNTVLLVVRSADGPNTVQELIAKAKANPGKLNYGAGAITTRLGGYLFNRTAGIDAVFVPYKGSADVVQGLLNGSIDFSVDGIAPYVALIRSGKLRALAKLDGRPLQAFPELEPLTVAAGLPSLGDIWVWTGLVAPAGTPTVIIEKIHRTVVKMYADPELVNRLQRSGITATSSSPAEFDAFFRAEANRWSKFIKETGIKLD